MFKKEFDSFKKIIIPASNQRYLSTPKKNYEPFGKLLERNPDNPFKTIEDQFIFDFFVLFDKGKPDILFSQELMQLGEWQDYGTKLYRLNTTHSIEDVKALLISELELDGKQFLVSTAWAGRGHSSL